MNYCKLIKENNLFQTYKQFGIGIERESLRTVEDYKLALTDSPEPLGKRAIHPYLITDFSESQPELITPVATTIKETMDWLAALHDVYIRSMEEDEYLWPFSMPNILPDDKDIPIIKVPEQFELDYRNYLAEQYGKQLQMISGIHFNFSFSDDFINQLFKYQNETENYQDFRDKVYLKLSRNFLRYHWIITYLYGAAPIADDTFYESETHPKEKPTGYMRSIRNSSYGYHNFTDVNVPLNSTEDYVKKIQELVKNKVISEEREFYGDARLKGYGNSAQDILNQGIAYVEYRSIDVNPFSEWGLSKEQIEFLHLFSMTMIWLDENATEQGIETGNDYNLEVAMEKPNQLTKYKDEGLRILDIMEEIAREAHLPKSYLTEVRRAKEAIDNPELTYAMQIVKELENASYLELGEKIGQAYKAKAYEKPFLLRGFTDMEMSSQLVMFDAIQRGLKVRVLDRQDQFLELSYKDHVEYVRNGNQTSHDTYISHWVMGNKTVTKKLLAEQGFKVPGGSEYQTIDSALLDYDLYKDQAIVIKPKSTNYGIGISIFKDKFSKKSYKKALEIAFKEDKSVLVEEYISGTEYRFFVIDGVTQSVLLRKPANVLGDGEHTIRELIDEKNDDNLRGENHRAPLAIIEMGELESLMLEQQGYDFDSVPEKDVTVYLRENSNISTGGDSLDITDDVHDSYKEVAVQMAKALNVNISGIDLIIEDISVPTTEHDPKYTLIEMNFNPAMNMHAYVYEGEGRRLSHDVINMLFPELPKRKNR